jgi:hypothetical protein
MFRMSRSLYRLLGLALFCPMLAFGQKDTASIVGAVTDNTGATVPGAVIDAVSLETNFTYHATSNQAGEWTISPVRIGTYRVTITAPGFSKAEVGPITLDVQQRKRTDVALQPGSITQTVIVKQTVPLLEVDT